MPGFLRACYLTVCRYLTKGEGNKKPKIKRIEIEETEPDQTNTQNRPPNFGKDAQFNLNNYLHLKLQLIHNLEEVTTINDKKPVRNLDMREMIIQEINLLTRLLDK